MKPRAQEAAMPGNQTTQGRFATVNGLRIYYEIHGAGEPIVLLHGGVGGIEMFGPNVQALARTRKVVAVDLEGHGFSGDLDRPLRYEQMADDVAALIGQLGLGTTDVLGYSLGGGVALQIGARHPELVRKLVLVSTTFTRAAFYPEIRQAFDHMGPETGRFMAQSPLAKLYPDRDWGRLFGRIGELQRQEYDWSEEVRAIRAQVLLVYADADTYHPEYIVRFFALLGGGRRDAGMDGSLRPAHQLAVLAGHTHYSLGTSPALLAVVEPFLAAPVPPAA
jgi:pimeloyl-ACP methyl ester carboxylesterase